MSSRYKTMADWEEAIRTLSPGCKVCRGSPGTLVLDALQVPAARERWQWADLGAGANECPGCINPAPAAALTSAHKGCE